MHNFGAKEMANMSTDFLEPILLLHLVENVIYGTTSPDCVGIAQFACQFSRTSPYVTRGCTFHVVIVLAGSFLPQTQCLEGRQSR